VDIEQTQEQQTTEAEQAPVDDISGPSRDDLIAAVREAGGVESVDVEAEAKAAGTPPPEKPAPADGEPDEPKIAAVIRAREKAFRETRNAEDYAGQLRQQAEQEAQRLIAEARARAQAEFDAEVQQRRRKFEESPTEALRALGKDPQDIADAVIREGTAEWKMIRTLQQELEATKQKASAADQVKSEFTQWKQHLETQQRQAEVEQIRSQFLTANANPEKVPSLYQEARVAAALVGRSPEDIVFDTANALATQWQKAGMRLGIDFDRDDVAAYLEHQSKQRLAAVGSAPQQVGGVPGIAPKVKANGSRTLSAATGSERRTSPKPLHEMTPDEEREALIEEARRARASMKSDS
jgi:hypothetical protein